MNEGAFALIDCLGFKGVWRRVDPEALIRKLTRIDEVVRDRVRGDSGAFKYLSYGPIDIHLSLLSDTVAIGLTYQRHKPDDPEEWQKHYLVGLMCHALVSIQELFLEEPALTMRGCVVFGSHLCRGNFLVGPAVDLAAESMNAAAGAFVWLEQSAAERLRLLEARTAALLKLTPQDVMPSVLKVLKERDREGKFAWLDKLVTEHGASAVGQTLREMVTPMANPPVVLDPYPVPLKNGTKLSCPVVNPLAFTRTSDAAAVIQRYAQAMAGDRSDVVEKRINTLAFLESARIARESFEQRLTDAWGHSPWEEKPTKAK
jgi:hypothetical protein